MGYVYKSRLRRFLVGLFDAAGALFVFPFKACFRPAMGKDIRRILIIRLDHIGDVAYTTSLPENLKARFPEAKITFLVSNAARVLVAANPYVDKVLCFDAPWFERSPKKNLSWKGFFRAREILKQGFFDLGLDPRGDLRHILLMCLSGVRYKVGYGITGAGFLLDKCPVYRDSEHVLQRNLDLLRSINIKIVRESVYLSFTKEDDEEMQRFLRENNLGQQDQLVILHPYAGYPSKNWREERFAELADSISRELSAKTVFIGSAKDRKAIERLIAQCHDRAANAAGKISLGALLALLQQAKLFIGVDSGPSHLAVAMNTPAVVLYSGTNRAGDWLLQARRSAVIQKDTACRGCELKECPENMCMELISVQDVMKAVRQLIGKA